MEGYSVHVVLIWFPHGPPCDDPWREGKDDPTIRLLTVTPERGGIWDSANKLVSGAKMVFAVMAGSTPKLGDNTEVSKKVK